MDKIVAHKRAELAARPAVDRPVEFERIPLDFHAALTRNDQANRVSLIAEVKKASPSKGLIRKDFDPVSIARAYHAAGAQCISVLTDEHFFQGHLDYLRQIRAAVELPLLRKDFILQPSQVYEARLAGADAVLLIAECLSASELKDLHDLIVKLGMTPLVELYEEKNIDAVLDCNPKLVGVNNRDLRTFEVDLHHSIRIKSQLPDSVALVSESGIFTHSDIELMGSHGVAAVLVGESLMRQTDVEQAVRSLMESSSNPASPDEGDATQSSRIFHRPKPDEYHEFYEKYIQLVPESDVWAMANRQPRDLSECLQGLPDAELNRLHEPYTWTLKQVVGHLIDGERTFGDRLWRIGVGDSTPIPGIDQQMYVRGVDYRQLAIQDLLDEFEHLRRANLLAVGRLSTNAMVRRGIAADNPVSARANFYIMVGHVEYHLRIIRDRVDRN